VELVTDSDKRIVFDCGTGARLLGAHLMANVPKPITVAILLSHTHWDHIQGFPFFGPAFVSGNAIKVCAPEGSNRSLPEVLAGQMEYTYFPVELSQLGAAIEYQELTEGTYDINDICVSTQYLNHPAITLGYKVVADDVTVLYLCDHEPYSATLWRRDADHKSIDSILHANDRRHALFMAGADVVIHDAQYTAEEYPAKKNWGHSTFEYVVELAAAARVRKLFLTHHDPMHDDTFIAGVEKRARQIARDAGSDMEVSCAFEGCEQTVAASYPATGHHLVAPALEGTACLDSSSLNILIIDDDEELRILASHILRKNGHKVSELSSGAEALATIEKNKPDLVLLDLFMPPPDGFEVLRMLRARPDLSCLPIIVLTASGDEASTRLSFDRGATDFLSKPFTPPQLNARVRTAFSRAASTRI
jgi:CheY-like chemotaxis protein/phosphoribosyl 1,2-cyclic phosphodiesterase